jgi:hypothetical protein
MINRRKSLAAALIAGAVGVLFAASSTLAEPSADQVLADLGLSPGDKDRVLQGEYVNIKIGSVSERDLTFATVFLCVWPPERLAKEILAGILFTNDPQVQAHGTLSPQAGPANFAGVHIAPEDAAALSKAEAGQKVNLSAAEIAAFRAEAGRPAQDIEQTLQRTLLARYQAYLSSGLEGLAPYDRGGGHLTNVASELKLAAQVATALRKYLPSFHQYLADYPKAAPADVEEQFAWTKSDIRGKATYALTHILVAASGAARAVVRREFYVSTGYDAEQAIAGFLPAADGTIVVYSNHAFTEQVAGAGGSLKRSVGSRIMADTLKRMFDQGRRRVER